MSEVDLQTKSMLITLSQYYYNVDESNAREVFELIAKSKSLKLPTIYTHTEDNCETHSAYQLIHHDTKASDIIATYDYVFAVLNK